MGRAATPERLAYSARRARALLPAGRHAEAVSESMRNPDYAATLRRIAEHGAEEFYTGEIGARIAADMAANGALLSGDDLSDYAPQRTHR